MKQSNTLITVFFLIIIIALVSCSDTDLNGTSEQRNIVTQVETTLISKDDFIRLHQVPAVFIATNRADLAFQLSGTINHVMVKIGEKVQKGQALMSLYNPNIDPALDTNIAQSESIKVKIVQVKRDVANLKELRKNNSASRNALEQKQTDLKDLLAQRKSIEAQMSLALANQSESIIKAPYASIVVSVGKQLGEFVSAGQSVITVNQQSELEVEVNITQSLWKNIQLGGLIKANYQGKQIEFTVVELAKTAEFQSHLMKVVLKLNTQLDSAIGQQVELHFPEKYENVYQLPLEVIVDDGINKPYIFLAINDMAVKSSIKPLYIEGGKIIFSTFTDIKGAVVIKGQSKISVGMKLHVQFQALK